MSITKFFVNIINNATYVKNSIYLWFKGWVWNFFVSLRLPLRLTSLLECILFPSTSMAYASSDSINIVLYWAYAHSSRIAKMSTWQNNIFLQENILNSHNFMLCLAQIINLLLKSLLLVNHNAILENKCVLEQ